jgi:two-component system phosphoglycerate transport system response regulator PgtA
MKIHLVEDNPDMLESLRLLLELRGYRVKTYLRALDLLEATGAEAVEPGDIVVSDYYLPDMNGVELMRRVRDHQPRVRTVLLTGSREQDIAAAARKLRDCTVLYKPLDFEALERGIFRIAGPDAGPA